MKRFIIILSATAAAVCLFLAVPGKAAACPQSVALLRAAALSGVDLSDVAVDDVVDDTVFVPRRSVSFGGRNFQFGLGNIPLGGRGVFNLNTGAGNANVNIGGVGVGRLRGVRRAVRVPRSVAPPRRGGLGVARGLARPVARAGLGVARAAARGGLGVARRAVGVGRGVRNVSAGNRGRIGGVNRGRIGRGAAGGGRVGGVGRRRR